MALDASTVSNKQFQPGMPYTARAGNIRGRRTEPMSQILESALSGMLFYNSLRTVQHTREGTLEYLALMLLTCLLVTWYTKIVAAQRVPKCTA